MNYRTIQCEEIILRKISLNEHSTCWSRMHAHVDGSRTICKWHPINSYAATFDLFHEIGHIETNKSDMRRCEQESEATRWAVNRFKELSIPIKQRVLRRYKDYIKMTWERGMRRGLQKKVKSSLYL